MVDIIYGGRHDDNAKMNELPGETVNLQRSKAFEGTEDSNSN
jgi:hypothetical protein